MKRCPKCGFETADSEKNFCPECSHQNGNGLVRLEMVRLPKASDKRPSPDISLNSSRGIEKDSVKAAESIAAAMSATGSAAVKGDANVVGRDAISVDKRSQSVNVEIKDLSEAERLRQNKAAFHDECVKLIKDGFVDDDARRQLSAFRESLGLHKDIADFIQKQVTEESVRKRTALPMAAIQLIERVKGAIDRNDKVQIQSNLLELDAYKAKMDDDNLDQIYFQLKAITSPDKFVKDYSQSTTSYWEAFWSYVALIRVDVGKAVLSLADLVRWDYHYPYQNQSVLQTIGLLMQDRELEAREAYKSILTGYSSDLEPIRFAISELLDKDWSEVTDVSPRARFYVDSLFRKAYDRICNQAQKVQIDIIEGQRQKELEARETQHRKEDFLQRYKEKKGSVSDALLLSGVTQTQFDEWKRTEANFRLALEEIDKCLAKEIEELKDKFIVHYESDNGNISDALVHSNVKQEQFDDWKGSDSRFRTRLSDIEERLAAIREEEGRRVKVKKEQFLSLYEKYACDIQKSCKEIDISPETVKSWRDTDSSFNNSLSYIKRKHAEKRRKKILSVVIPCILIVALCVIIGPKLKSVSDARQATANAISRYTDATTNLNAIIESIPGDVNYISIEKHYNALVAGCDSLKTIVGLEKKSELKGKDESSGLRQNLLDKADIVYEYAKSLLGTSSDVPGYEDERRVGLKYVNEINDLKQLISNVR